VRASVAEERDPGAAFRRGAEVTPIFATPARDWWVEVRPVLTWTPIQRSAVGILLNMDHTAGASTTGLFVWFRRNPDDHDAHRFTILAEQVGPIRVAARPFDREDRPWRDDEWVTVGLPSVADGGTVPA
jgi:hypothetical protein